MADTSSPTLHFHYVKSQLFRVIHADGVMGGVTPKGLIHMGLFSERPAFPQAQTYRINPEGTLSEPLSTEGKEGLVREIDVDTMLTKETAIAIRDWLARRVEELDRIETEIAAMNENS